MDTRKHRRFGRIFQILETCVQKSKYIVSGILFLMVCLAGSLSDASSKTVTVVTDPATKSQLKLVAVENDTQNCEFQIFSGSDIASGLVFPQTVFRFNPTAQLTLSSKDLIVLKCCKGSFLPVFIQYGGLASGDQQEGFDGPFYLSMWLNYPQVPEISKTRVRCLIKSGTIGTIGVKIGNRGDYRFVAYENVHFVI